MIAALAAQFQASVSLAIGLGRDVGLTVVNFFSFFTVLSNLGAALVLASIAWTSVQRPGTLTRTAGLALACVTTAMLVFAGRGDQPCHRPAALVPVPVLEPGRFRRLGRCAGVRGRHRCHVRSVECRRDRGDPSSVR